MIKLFLYPKFAIYQNALSGQFIYMINLCYKDYLIKAKLKE